MVREHIGPYSPTNATKTTLWAEQAAIDGSGFGFIAYGVHFTLFVITFSSLWNLRRSRPTLSYTMMIYIFCLFSCGTVVTFRGMHYLEQQFVDDINFPGGPLGWEILKNDVPGLAATVINTWLQDGIIIYRFFVIYGYDWRYALLPCLGFIASILLSCVVLWGLSHPGATFLSLSNLSTAYLSISVGTTILLTLAIVLRMLKMRRLVLSTIGLNHAVPYLSISTMLIESAFLYSACALPHTVLMGLQNPGQLLTIAILSQVQSIAPLLIVYHVARGHAWSKETFHQIDAVTNCEGASQDAHHAIEFSSDTELTRAATSGEKTATGSIEDTKTLPKL